MTLFMPALKTKSKIIKIITNTKMCNFNYYNNYIKELLPRYKIVSVREHINHIETIRDTLLLFIPSLYIINHHDTFIMIPCYISLCKGPSTSYVLMNHVESIRDLRKLFVSYLYISMIFVTFLMCKEYKFTLQAFT